MELLFRKPTPADRIKIDKFLSMLKNDYVPPFSEHERTKQINNIYDGKANATLAVTKKGRIIGYISWMPHAKKKGYGYVDVLGIHPEHRRKGISLHLRKLAFREIKKAGLKGVYYTTWHTNIAMVNSSKKLGMEIVKTYLDEKFRGPGIKTVLFKKEF